MSVENNFASLKKHLNVANFLGGISVHLLENAFEEASWFWENIAPQGALGFGDKEKWSFKANKVRLKWTRNLYGIGCGERVRVDDDQSVPTIHTV